MVSALFPRIMQGQAGARAAHGIVAHGTVVATRVTGGVPSGREAVLRANWRSVPLAETGIAELQQFDDEGGPIGIGRQLGYALSSVTVIDGGEYDQAPPLLVVNAGTTHVPAAMTATVAGGTITGVSVTEAGVYALGTGQVVAQPVQRTQYCDVDVLGGGGRRYTLTDCATVVPVRVGDTVALEAPNGDPRLGVYVSGRQVPARPLVYQAPTDVVPERDTDLRHRIGDRIAYRYLGWPQAFAFDVYATVAMGWNNDGNWRARYPTAAELDLEVQLQTLVAGSWTDQMELARITGGAELFDDPNDQSGRWRWSGIYQIDDGSGTLRGLLSAGTPAAIAFYLDATGHRVKWNGNPGGWLITDISAITPAAVADVDPPYTIQVVELGEGTY